MRCQLSLAPVRSAPIKPWRVCNSASAPALLEPMEVLSSGDAFAMEDDFSVSPATFPAPEGTLIVIGVVGSRLVEWIAAILLRREPARLRQSRPLHDAPFNSLCGHN